MADEIIFDKATRRKLRFVREEEFTVRSGRIWKRRVYLPVGVADRPERRVLFFEVTDRYEERCSVRAYDAKKRAMIRGRIQGFGEDD